MTYKTDKGGFAFKCSDIKITTAASTWGTKLSQIFKQKGIVRIITYSLPDLEYIQKQFERRPHDILLIAHWKFMSRAQQIKRTFPGIRIAVHREVHSKVLLIEPHTVYISSANFGDSGWHETSIGLHSNEAHDWYVKEQFTPLWDSCGEVGPYMTREEADHLLDTIRADCPHFHFSDAHKFHEGGGQWHINLSDTIYPGKTLILSSPADWEQHRKRINGSKIHG